MAVIAGLNALKEPCSVLVTTDSKYVKDGLSEWLENWKAILGSKGVPGKQPVKNRDLWEQPDLLKKRHSIKLEWVKGHSDHMDNICCDELATKAARRYFAPNVRNPQPG